MSLMTLFSAPKGFSDPDIARSQRNAIESWRRLGDVDILLLGDEVGLATAAREMGARHLPNVSRNPSGVPLISSMFQLARESSHSQFLAIINADIILTPDFLRAAKQLSSLKLDKGFVLVSQRWDLDVREAMDYSNGWEERLRLAADTQGRLHRPMGSDFFVFPRDCYRDVPDFTIGRAGWDNWMIYKARQEGWAVIDGTPSMLIVHQNHDYRHLPGAKPHYDHPDTLVNMRLAGGQAAIRYTILDATHVLVHGRRVRPRWTRERFTRGVELLLRRVLFFLPENMLESVARPRRWSKRFKRFFGKTDS